jgi:hypothetical protein
MAESRSEKPIVRHKHTRAGIVVGSYHKESRRRFLKRALAVVGLGTAAVVTGGAVLKEGPKVKEWAEDNVLNPETDLQKRAKELYEKASEHSLIKNLVVKGEGDSEYANFRDEPRTYIDAEENIRHIEGKINKGEEVERAIAVWGNDPKLPADSARETVWLAFPRGDRVVFAHAELFEHNNKLEQTKPYDLEAGEPRDRRRAS